MVVRVFATMWNFLSVSGFIAWYASGSDNIGEVHNLIFLDKNPSSGFNWLCLKMVLLQALF
jgi:hypothetical protein